VWPKDIEASPGAAVFDGSTLQSTPESGTRAGYDGHKQRKGRKAYIAVDTLGHLLALAVTSANEQERAHVEELAKAVQDATEQSVELAYVDQVRAGQAPAQTAQKHSIEIEVVTFPEAKKASCCCHAARRLSAALPGLDASAV
jgi:hypothetical protein